MGGTEIRRVLRAKTFANPPTSHNSTPTPNDRLLAVVLFAGSNRWAGDDAFYTCTGATSSTRGHYFGAIGIPQNGKGI